MRIGIVLDPLDSLKIYKDSTFAMMAEAASRGHELHVAMQEGLMWKNGWVCAELARLHLTCEDDVWYRLEALREERLCDLDCVLNRKDPPFDIEYITSTWMLEHAVRQGARVFNEPGAVRDHNEKFTIAQFSQFAAPTLVARLDHQIQRFIDEHADVVLKPLEGMGGSSVFRVTDRDPNRNVIIETLTHHGTRTIMAQRYIPEIRNGDKRVLLIEGKPVPYCLARIPKAGESRGNLAAGGTGVARPLTARDEEIAHTLGPELARRGLLLVGLDVIGDYLTEVNVTSPTCFREITDQTGFNVAGMFVDALERTLAGTNR